MLEPLKNWVKIFCVKGMLMNLSNIIKEILLYAENDVIIQCDGEKSSTSKEKAVDFLRHTLLRFKSTKYTLQYINRRKYIQCEYYFIGEKEIPIIVRALKPGRESKLALSIRAEEKLERIKKELKLREEKVKEKEQLIRANKQRLVSCPYCTSSIESGNLKKHIKKLHKNLAIPEKILSKKSGPKYKKSKKLRSGNLSIRTYQGGLPSLGKKR